MYSYYIAIITFMRMRIAFGRFTMSSPSGMSNTTASDYGCSIICFLCEGF